MRTFNTSSELAPYLVIVLDYLGIPYMLNKKEDAYKMDVDMSGTKFHKVVQLATCEKMYHEKPSHLPHIPRWAYKHPDLMKIIRERARQQGFTGNGFVVVNF